MRNAPLVYDPVPRTLGQRLGPWLPGTRAAGRNHLQPESRACAGLSRANCSLRLQHRGGFCPALDVCARDRILVFPYANTPYRSPLPEMHALADLGQTRHHHPLRLRTWGVISDPRRPGAICTSRRRLRRASICPDPRMGFVAVGEEPPPGLSCWVSSTPLIAHRRPRAAPEHTIPRWNIGRAACRRHLSWSADCRRLRPAPELTRCSAGAAAEVLH